MKSARLASVFLATIVASALSSCFVWAEGVPIAGFSPLVGLTLTNRFKTDSDQSFTFYLADIESSLVGTQFGEGGSPYYDLALLDIGAAVSLITADADAAFGLEAAGFREPNAHRQQIGGASGTLFAPIDDPLAMFAVGLANRTNASNTPLTFNAGSPGQFKGQSSVSILTLPPESELPSVIGIPFISQYTTYIRNDQPQIFQQDGRTVRAPQIEFLPLGSGGQGIARRAPMQLRPGSAFTAQPTYLFDFDNIFADPPVPLTEHPSAPTILQEPGAMFLNVNVKNDGQTLNGQEFFMDTGADVTVMSTLTALQMGFNIGVTEPDFSIEVIGSGGVTQDVPGFFLDELTILSVGAATPYTLTKVPIVVLDVPDPTDPSNFVDGIIGTNILAGRNIVIDPKPAISGGTPSVYIGEPVATAHSWSTTAASASWITTTNWSTPGTPGNLWIANAANVSGAAEEAVVSANSTVWELNVSGAAPMTVRVQSGARLTTFSGVNLVAGGQVRLDGGTLDAQFVDIRGGTLSGSGTVTTGSGPISGQVENLSGTVAPGNSAGTLTIIGRYSNGHDGRLEMELGGLAPGSTHDQLVVDGRVALDGELALSLIGAFTPSVGDTFTLITSSGGVSGTFANILEPLGYNWRVEYESNMVNLVVGIPGDYNDDGAVDAADYTVWRNAVGTTNREVDGNGSGLVDAGDYLVWKNHYGESASGAATGNLANVPEPTSVLLGLMAVAWLSAVRRRQTIG